MAVPGYVYRRLELPGAAALFGSYACAFFVQPQLFHLPMLPGSWVLGRCRRDPSASLGEASSPHREVGLNSGASGWEILGHLLGTA